MPLPTERTLGDLRAELAARLGFANQGPPSLLQRTILDSFLRSAQVITYWTFEDENKRRQSETITTAVSQTLYDIPDGVLPGRTHEVEVLVVNFWLPMHKGIEGPHDSFVDAQHFPQRFDITGGQFEIWPEPDDIYTIRFEDWGTLGPFSQDAHVASVDSDALFELALYYGKLHYKQADAEAPLNNWNILIAKKRGGQHRGRRYVRGHRRSPQALAEPYGTVPPVRI